MTRKLFLPANWAFVVCICAIFSGCVTTSWSEQAGYDLTQTKSVHFGWIDFHEEDWPLYHYGSQDEWYAAIFRTNAYLQRKFSERWAVDKWKPYKKTMIVGGAKRIGNEPEKDWDILIQFSDVIIDREVGSIYLTVHFRDGKSGKLLFSVEQERFPCQYSLVSFERFLQYSVESLSNSISAQFE